MSILHILSQYTIKSLGELYPGSFSAGDFQINQTKPEFEGDYTLVLFSLVKKLKIAPEALCDALGRKLVQQHPEIFSSYNIIKGFLNLSISDSYWVNILSNSVDPDFGKSAPTGRRVMVEYSSPNTNKPLHLGHLRNNFLGWSVAEILKFNGNEVFKSCIVNDRGVHICKSMLAWEKWGNKETPKSTGIKGDHLVGDYYVKFENALKREAEELKQKEGNGNFVHYDAPTADKVQVLSNALANLNPTDTKYTDKKEKIEGELKELRRGATPLMKEVKQMLVDWEAGKPEVIALWKQMNNWVYEGFDVTYKKIGTDFDKVYYESNTYLLGKDIVEEGLKKNVFFKKDDGSVWIDLQKEGLDEKLVLRKDGTSVYITQDIGLAEQKYREFNTDQSIYVIADEQNYHMTVLKLICQKLGLAFAHDIFHLSYGMVELPSGRMKSREGTVVDADDMIEEMVKTAQKHTTELGKVNDFTEEELSQLYETLGIGAIKFYLLRVDPKKRMVFNPEESIDFHGFTGPFIQYTHARIKSILRKAQPGGTVNYSAALLPLEKELLVSIEHYPEVLQQAAKELNPSVLANYLFSLAKTFNSFYSEHQVANAETEEKKQLRLRLAVSTGNILSSGLKMLGIRAPERM
ncbi:MAG: arginine--tRNA ligase [Chitinophagaceae bacterium]|nr:arginine--tRNA ligase [Bacteroidota bacterium]MCC6258244.1 arginine--tRNA ligase [Chitinophagaceae bacterium]